MGRNVDLHLSPLEEFAFAYSSSDTYISDIARILFSGIKTGLSLTDLKILADKIAEKIGCENGGFDEDKKEEFLRDVLNKFDEIELNDKVFGNVENVVERRFYAKLILDEALKICQDIKIPKAVPPPIASTSQATGDNYLKQASADWGMYFLDNSFTLRAGVFSADQSAIDIYTSGNYVALDKKSKWIRGAINLQLGLDLDVPFHSDYGITGFGSISTLLYSGLEQKLASWFKFREGIELSPYYIYGLPSAQSFGIPFDSGISGVFTLPNNDTIAIGAIVRSPFMIVNVQDAGSYMPTFESFDPFLSINSVISAKLMAQMYIDRIDGYAEISKTFNINGGNLLTHLISVKLYYSGQISGDEFYRGQGLFFGFTYGIEDHKLGQRFDLDIEADSLAFRKEKIQVKWVKENDTSGFTILRDFYDYAGQYDKFNGQEVSLYETEDPGKVRVELKGELNSNFDSWFNDACVLTGKDTWTCGSDHESKDKDGNVIISWTQQIDITKQGDRYYAGSIRSNAVFNDPFLDALSNNKTLDGFVNQLKSASLSEKIRYLNSLAFLAYGTYNKIGLHLTGGDGSVNTINEDDIYTALRNNAIAGVYKPTTVCRGFAKFITETADKWGFEARSSSISTRDYGHFISLAREHGKDYYYYINYGDEIITTSPSGSMLTALEAYARYKGYGPQFQFDIYNENGRYLGTLDTTYGLMFKARMLVAPSRLRLFLEGAE